VRILILNPNGLDPWNDYKMSLFHDAIEQLDIDIMMLSKINLKYTTTNKSKMKHRIKKLGCETRVFMMDSGQWQITRYNYLPGGILAAIRGKAVPLIQDEEIYFSKLGNFVSVKLKQINKIIALITLYRVPSTSPQEPSCCVTQYNVKEGKLALPNEYRKGYIIIRNEKVLLGNWYGGYTSSP